MATTADGRVLAAWSELGNSAAPDPSAHRVYQLSGSTWVPLGPSLNSTVNALLPLRGGDLVAGGNFTLADNWPSATIARWRWGNPPSPLCGTLPPSQAVCTSKAAELSVPLTFSQQGPTRFQWRRNGQPLTLSDNPTALSQTFVIPTPTAADLASMDCLVTVGCLTEVTTAVQLTLTRACSTADLPIGGQCPDGTVDGGDFIAFINSFGIGDATVDSTADIAGGGDEAILPDGTIDAMDFIAFINEFAIGC
jgi:hypothetical protein